MPPFLHDGEGIGHLSSVQTVFDRLWWRTSLDLNIDRYRNGERGSFTIVFGVILFLEGIWWIWMRNENENYWKKVFNLILVIAFFFCEFLLSSLKFCGGKVTFSYGDEARIGRWSVSCENRKCKLKIKISTFFILL